MGQDATITEERSEGTFDSRYTCIQMDEYFTPELYFQ